MEEGKKRVFAAELKKDLQRAVENFTNENEDHSLEAIDEAMKTLSVLNDLAMMMRHDRNKEAVIVEKIDKSQEDSNTATTSDDKEGWLDLVPDEFKCPISGSLMVDPVVISSGQTYDKQCIQKWFENGHQKCPKTDEKLSHTHVIPNNTIKKLILKWCEQNNVQVPAILPTGDEGCTGDTVNQEYLVMLLEKLASLISDARGAAKEIQTLTNKLPSVGALVSNDASGAITRPFSQLLFNISGFNEELNENLVATLLSISIHENNRNKLLQEIPAAISFLVNCLRDERIEMRIQAAATVCILSEVHSNRQVIGNSGAIKFLIELIKEGHPLALKDAVYAIFWLCALPQNRERAISEGVVTVIIRNINDRKLFDEMLYILRLLSPHKTAIAQMDENEGIPALFRLLEEGNINENQKEVCVDILHTICFSDEKFAKSIWKANGPGDILSRIETTGSDRTQMQAGNIIRKLAKVRNFTQIESMAKRLEATKIKSTAVATTDTTA